MRHSQLVGHWYGAERHALMDRMADQMADAHQSTGAEGIRDPRDAALLRNHIHAMFAG
jgi:hypothetical protein